MNIHTLYHPFLIYFRAKRMQQVWEKFQLTPQTRVLDVGGSWFNWSLLPEQPDVIILNMYPSHEKGTYKAWVVGDGCCLPFADQTFDLVYSNSVIEHLSSFENQQQFAAECQRVGIRVYVQTPNKWFLIEPHLLTPAIHWLPRQWSRRLLRNFTVWGLITRPDGSTCDRFLNEVRLLDKTELQTLFPDATIWCEKFLGLTKSLIAVNDVQH